MTRIYLTISYQQKDGAKEDARKGGTRIQWDGQKKKWYWEGDGNLPECLNKYQFQTTPQAYASRRQSFNKFLASDAGRRYQEEERRIIREDLGIEDLEQDRRDLEARLDADHEADVERMGGKEAYAKFLQDELKALREGKNV